MMRAAIGACSAAAAGLLLTACASDGPAPIVVGDLGGAEAAAGSAQLSVAPVTFELAAQLPPLDGPAPAYRASGSGASAEDAQRIASALGMAAPVPTEAGWSATEADGRTLLVADGPLGDWFFGRGVVQACAEPADPSERTEPGDTSGLAEPGDPSERAEPADTSGLAEPGDPAEPGDCAEPVPPTDLPSDAEAIAAAQSLMAQIRQPVAGGAQVERDVFGVSVVFPQQLGGLDTPYWPTVRFGAGAELESANGYLGSFDDAGPYPRIGTDDAFALLESGGGQPWLPATSLPVEQAVPVPGGEATVVRIVGVAEGLWTLFGVDGSTWLVPSYVFSDADGGEYPVLALPDDLIEVEETAVLPQPAEGPATSSVP